MNRVIIGSGNGLSPVRRQVITWTNADLFDAWGQISVKFESKFISIHENAFENVACQFGGHFVQAPLLSNKISLIQGSRIKWKSLSPPAWHKIW